MVEQEMVNAHGVAITLDRVVPDPVPLEYGTNGNAQSKVLDVYRMKCGDPKCLGQEKLLKRVKHMCSCEQCQQGMPLVTKARLCEICKRIMVIVIPPGVLAESRRTEAPLPIPAQ